MALGILRTEGKAGTGAEVGGIPPRRGSSARRIVLCLAIVQGAPLLADAVYDGSMSGDVISPPVSTQATGAIDLSLEGDTLAVDLVFSGLSGISTGSHIHCCADLPTAGAVAILLPDSPVGVTSATYATDLDLGAAGTYTAGFMTACAASVGCAKSTLLEGFRAGRAYLCVHSTIYPAGELRAYPDWVSFEDGFESGGVDVWTIAVGFVP